MNEQMYSVDQVADLLGLHVKTVRNYVREGRLKAVRIGKQYRISPEDLESFTGRPLKEPPPRRPAELTGIVEVGGIGRPVFDRIGTYLTSAVSGEREGGAVRIELAYDEARASLKVVVFGDLARGADLLALLNTLVEAEK
ncbi:helix-turn-helix domain-containing protein [Actinocorallia aurantiaca]|uniref:Helix-turn-helix domain-containing protein n=1 Tax=Actinocorallia aurantiaca TaxID=46204 RepID=A0ABN3U4D1_9ACTN